MSEFEQLLDDVVSAYQLAAGEKNDLARWERLYHDYEANKQAAIDAFDAQAARIRELEAALWELGGGNPPIWAASVTAAGCMVWVCRYCNMPAVAWQQIEHAPDCPISKTRALLSKEPRP